MSPSSDGRPTPPGRSPVAVAVALAVTCIGVLVAAELAGIYVPRLTRDPSTIDGRFGTGAVSLLGTVAWAAAATALALAAAVARTGLASSAQVRRLAGSAAFTAFLCLDDTFAVHENAERLGDSAELAVGLLYLAIAGCWLAWARPLADEGQRDVLLLAGGLLAASLAVDTLADGASLELFGAHTTLVEDALKSAGIAAWLVWAASLAWAQLRPAPQRDPVGRHG